MKSIQKSPVRIRVENFFQQLDGRPDESVLRTLFFSLILGLCSFCNADNEPGEKEYFEKERNKFIIEYSADSSLFEMGCYLFFRFDLWHVKNVREEYRDAIFYNYLVKKFLQLFENSLRIDNSHEILQNRMNIYGELIRRKPDRIKFYLSQLIIRSGNNTMPQVHKYVNFPVIITGLLSDELLRIEIERFDQIMIPICLDKLEHFYNCMPQELKSFCSNPEIKR